MLRLSVVIIAVAGLAPCLALLTGFTGQASAESSYSFPLTGSALKKLRTQLKEDASALRQARVLCRNRKLAQKRPICDADQDKLINKRERRLGTNPLLRDTDFDGRTDYDEILKYKSNPLAVDNPDGGCYPLYFDSKGNTTQFDIPSVQIGNISRGRNSYKKTCGVCHAAADKGTNRSFSELKAVIGQAPMNLSALKDPVVADLVAYLNRSKLGAGSCGSIPGATPTPGGGGLGCSNQYFDANGDTSQFGIPSPLVGYITRGASFYAARCQSCHGARGTNFTFAQMKSAVTGPLMKITNVTDQEFADLTAFANRSAAPQSCVATPTPGPGVTPTPLPTVSVPGCSNQYFDSNGDTTSFGIPTPLVGNLNAGVSYFNLACTGCHGDRGANFTFSQLKTAVTGPLMNIQSVTDQHYADLTAYVNRSSAPQNCGPSPTPTPIDDSSAGRLVFETSCQTCHRRIDSDLRTLTKSKLQEAIAEKSEMQGISLSDEQIRVLLVYLHSL